MSHNRRVLDALLAAKDQGRLHHAYLLSGPESPAKLECVESLAASFTGDKDRSLERIRQGNHPDFLRIDPQDGLIGVDDVRVLPKALAYPPLESQRRVVVLHGAQAMNSQAANAILKLLEEPPVHTMFFLVCRDPSELLPTIVSRCQVIRFAPLGEAELLAALGDRKPEDARALAAWSEGSLSRAERLLAEGAAAVQSAACERILELWEASPRIPSAVFAFVESLESEADCQIALDSWELMLRDLAFAASGAQARDLRFPAYFPRLSALTGGRPTAFLDDLPSRAGAINRFRVYRQLNGNLRLDMASLITKLQVFW